MKWQQRADAADDDDDKTQNETDMTPKTVYKTCAYVTWWK